MGLDSKIKQLQIDNQCLINQSLQEIQKHLKDSCPPRGAPFRMIHGLLMIWILKNIYVSTENVRVQIQTPTRFFFNWSTMPKYKILAWAQGRPKLFHFSFVWMPLNNLQPSGFGKNGIYAQGCLECIFKQSSCKASILFVAHSKLITDLTGQIFAWDIWYASFLSSIGID